MDRVRNLELLARPILDRFGHQRGSLMKTIGTVPMPLGVLWVVVCAIWVQVQVLKQVEHIIERS
jgi:hypothetical protein